MDPLGPWDAVRCAFLLTASIIIVSCCYTEDVVFSLNFDVDGVGPEMAAPLTH